MNMLTTFGVASVLLILLGDNNSNALKCYENLSGKLEIKDGCNFCMVFDNGTTIGDQQEERSTVAMCGKDTYDTAANAHLTKLCYGLMGYQKVMKGAMDHYFSKLGETIMKFRLLVNFAICDKELCNEVVSYKRTTMDVTPSATVSGDGLKCYTGVWMMGSGGQSSPQVVEQAGCQKCFRMTNIAQVNMEAAGTNLDTRIQMGMCINEENKDTFRTNMMNSLGGGLGGDSGGESTGSAEPEPSTACSMASMVINTMAKTNKMSSFMQLNADFCTTDKCNPFVKLEKETLPVGSLTALSSGTGAPTGVESGTDGTSSGGGKLKCYENIGGSLEIKEGCKFCMVFDNGTTIGESKTETRNTIALCGRDKYDDDLNVHLSKLCRDLMRYGKVMKMIGETYLSNLGESILRFRLLMNVAACQTDLCNEIFTYSYSPIEVKPAQTISGKGLKCYTGAIMSGGSSSGPQVIEQADCLKCVIVRNAVISPMSPVPGSKPMSRIVQNGMCINNENKDSVKNNIMSMFGGGEETTAQPPESSESSIDACAMAPMMINVMGMRKMQTFMQLDINFCSTDHCNKFANATKVLAALKKDAATNNGKGSTVSDDDEDDDSNGAVTFLIAKWMAAATVTPVYLLLLYFRLH